MRMLNIALPDNLDLSTKEVTTALAAQLYDIGKLSLRQAASLAGYSKANLWNSYPITKFQFSIIQQKI